MIKLSLNSPESSKQQLAAPFANTLAAAVEAAAAEPAQPKLAKAAPKKQDKPAYTPAPSTGLLSRSVRWLQHKRQSKKRLHMIETVSLGEKRFVALVKVDGREFLLGGAPSSVGMLADLGAHGLGELLGADGLAAASNVKPTSAIPTTSTAVPTHSAFPTFEREPAVKLPNAEAAEPMAFSLPVPVPESLPAATAAAAQPVAAPRLDIVVEAEDHEADWLVEGGTATTLKSAMGMETSSIREVAARATEFTPAAVEKELRPVAEKLGPIAVPTPAPASAANPGLNLNFTFQMWPTTQTSVTAPVDIVATQTAKPKARTHIDLQACPELLGEPYVLALVENTHGAAA